MSLLEKDLKRKVLKFLKKEYPKAWVYKTSDRWTSGIPDILICLRGYFYAVELKSDKGKLTRLQEYTLKMIKNADGKTAVCRSIDELKEFLKEEVRDSAE